MHLACPDVSVKVYDADGLLRRCSVAETVCRGVWISVELFEDVDLADLRGLAIADGAVETVR